jgi:hypothetical protein
VYEVHLKKEMCSDLVNKCRQDALVGVVGERVGRDHLTCTTQISFQLHSILPTNNEKHTTRTHEITNY